MNGDPEWCISLHTEDFADWTETNYKNNKINLGMHTHLQEVEFIILSGLNSKSGGSQLETHTRSW